MNSRPRLSPSYASPPFALFYEGRAVWQEVPEQTPRYDPLK